MVHGDPSHDTSVRLGTLPGWQLGKEASSIKEIPSKEKLSLDCNESDPPLPPPQFRYLKNLFLH